jgi:hypothetical protein
LGRVSLIKDCLFARTIPLRAFGKVHRCRPRLLAWSLFKESLQGIVDGSGSRAVGLDVGGDGVEAVMNVTGVLSARVLAQAGRKGTRHGRILERAVWMSVQAKPCLIEFFSG